MFFDNFFYSIPLWGIFLGTIALVLFSIFIGIYLGGVLRKSTELENKGETGNVVGATLGLLAFMLAFTFGIAASRFETRKQLLLDEVNALGTAYLRAGLVNEPYKTNIRKLLKSYVEIRTMKGGSSINKISQLLNKSKELLDEMWLNTALLAQADDKSEIVALFVESMNQVIDLHTSRVTVGLRYRIPESIWLGLYFVSVLSMIAVGYQFGSSRVNNLTLSFVLALTFSAVILLVADLDRSVAGVLKVSQQPMIELNQSWK